LPAKDGELVAEDEDLQVLGGPAAGKQRKELDGPAQREVGESWHHRVTSVMRLSEGVTVLGDVGLELAAHRLCRSIRTPRVRAVVFDIGGVLEIATDSDLEGRWERRLGLRRGEFFARLRRSGLVRDANLGRVSEEEFVQALGRLHGLDQPTTAELLADLWNWYVGELNTEMADYFQRLRPRYRTAILSNGAAGGRREEERRYGFASIADVLVYSYEVGIEKPDQRIYEITCERLGVHPGEVVFLDDLEANVVAARKLGMRAVLFKSTSQAITDVEACLADSAD
jgi:epoxide hydrolase-like predicted phosphatase